MTILVIKDLDESVELDREAMAAITGGARIPLQQTMLSRAANARLWIGPALSGVLHAPVKRISTPRRGAVSE
jgi:hypothetical protein